LDRQSGAPPFEIIVVDNGSTDDSVELVQSTYAHVRLVRSDANLGFAEGNNLGARAAAADWLVFLNNDTVVEPDWLATLDAERSSKSEFEVFTSRIVFLDEPTRLDSAGDDYYRAGGARKIGHGESQDSGSVSREVFGACGAAMVIRRALFESLGGFDPRFFMVYEDVDLSYRARLRGVRIWYAADAIVRHAGSGSIGTLSAATVYYGQRNLEWVWVKNTPPRLMAKTLVSHALYSLAGVLYYVRSGLGWAAIRGKLDALLGLGPMLAERRRVQRTRAIGDETLSQSMRRPWLADKRREKASDLRRATEMRDLS
jgi:hypothetical protein